LQTEGLDFETVALMLSVT